MKNVLFIIDSLGIGGAEKSLRTLAREMLKHNINVYIVIIYDKQQINIPDEIKLFVHHWQNYKFFKYYRNGKKLCKLIKDLHIDFSLVVVHLDKSIKLMKECNLPKVYNVIHSNLSIQDLGDRKGIRRFIKKRKLQSIYNNLNLITVSKGIERDILEVLEIQPRSIQTIYNPIDFDEIRGLAAGENSVKEERYIVHVGRLEKVKRHDILLEAYKRANIEEKLVIVGDGSERANIEKMISDLQLEEKVIMTGFLSNPYPVVKGAKLLVLTSDYEGFGLVLVESLVLDTLSVSVNCPFGPNEILVGSLKKFLIQQNNIEQLVDGIKNGLDSQMNCKIHDVIKHFSAVEIFNQYKRL